MTMTTMEGLTIESIAVYRKITPKGIRLGGGGHCSARTTSIRGPLRQFHIRNVATTQWGSLPGIIIIDETDVVLYIILQPQSVMVLG